MKYEELLQLLMEIEEQVPNRPPECTEAQIYVRSHKTCVQLMALDVATRDRDLPVVVAVGINYTQGDETTPRDLAKGSCAVEDKLGRCRHWVKHGFTDYRTRPEKWVEFSR